VADQLQCRKCPFYPLVPGILATVLHPIALRRWHNPDAECAEPLVEQVCPCRGCEQAVSGVFRKIHTSDMILVVFRLASYASLGESVAV
jgi:hypothetical protein